MHEQYHLLGNCVVLATLVETEPGYNNSGPWLRTRGGGRCSDARESEQDRS